jgi:hypothetical protein
MTWHLQPTSYTARLYAPGACYASRSPFRAVAQVEVLGDGLAYVHAVLRADGQPLTREDWRELGHLLLQAGVRSVIDERHGRHRRVSLAHALRL